MQPALGDDAPPMTSQPHARPPLRIAVLISGGGSTLSNLLHRIADGRISNVQIQRIISSRSNVRGVEIARSAGLPTTIIRRRDFPTDAAFSDEISRVLAADGIDLVVMAGFLCLWLIPPHLAGRVINVHPALLPEFGGRGMYGRHVHAAVLAAGRTESGCTVHLADNQYDHGPIIAQARVPILPGDTPESLAERVMAAERELYPQVIQKIAVNGFGWLPRGA